MKHLLISCLLTVLYSYGYLADTSSVGKTHFILHDNQLIIPPKKVTSQPLPLDHHGLVHEGCIKHALFSAYDDIQKNLIDLINKEQTSIKIAIYSFTDKEIAQALIAAHQKGVSIEIVCDCSCLQARFSKIPLLAQQGIKTHIYFPASDNAFTNDLMHHKFVLFEKNILDKSLLWTGSFNFTKSANSKNQENVLIVDDAYLIQLYNNHFTRLVKQITDPKNKTITLRVTKGRSAKKRSSKGLLA